MFSMTKKIQSILNEIFGHAIHASLNTTVESSEGF